MADFSAPGLRCDESLSPTAERERERERERRVGGTTTMSVAAERIDIAVSQGLTLFEARSQGTVATDNGSSGRQVEQACTRSAAPSSTSEVVEVVASHGRTSATSTRGVPQRSAPTEASRWCWLVDQPAQHSRSRAVSVPATRLVKAALVVEDIALCS